MSAALAITKRELRTYFNSPVAYIVGTVFLMLTGFLFFRMLFLEKGAEMRGFANYVPLLFTFIIPAITMRLIAEEKGSGSLELLVTMPVREWEVVVGKFLAAVGLLAALLGLAVVYAVTVAYLGPLDKGATFTTYLGLFLMGSAYVAVGVMASSFTRNQIVAFIIGLAISFILWLAGKIVQVMPESVQGFLAFIGTDTHFEALSRGVIDSRDVIYYLSMIAISLTIATVALNARKWK